VFLPDKVVDQGVQGGTARTTLGHERPSKSVRANPTPRSPGHRGSRIVWNVSARSTGIAHIPEIDLSGQPGRAEDERSRRHHSAIVPVSRPKKTKDLSPTRKTNAFRYPYHSYFVRGLWPLREGKSLNYFTFLLLVVSHRPEFSSKNESESVGKEKNDGHHYALLRY
jgi:hypothetical protein